MRPTPASADDIDATTLTRRVLASLPRLLVLAAIVGAATFGGLSMVAPRYQSEAQLTIEAKVTSNPFADPKQSGSPSEATANRMDREAINTHLRALQSPALAAEIVRRLELGQRAEFNPRLGPVDQFGAIMRQVGFDGIRPGQTDQDRVVETYFQNLAVFAARESRFISIRFTSIDPALAADVPNAIVEAYRAELASRQVEETRDVQDALGPKLAALSREVTAAEVAVEEFRGKVDSFNAGGQRQSLNEQQLGELTNELSKAQAARSESEARATSGREMLRSGSAEALPDVQKSPLIQALVQQRVRVDRQIAELSATLLPGHPRMRQLNAELAGLKRQVDAEVAKVVDSLAKEARVTAEREAAIRRRLAEVKTTVVKSGPDEAKLKALTAEAKSKRDELERLQAQFNANKSRVESKAVPVEVRVVSPAIASSVAVFPKAGALSALAALATFVLGLAVSVLHGVAKGARSQGAQSGGGGRDDARSERAASETVDPPMTAPPRVAPTPAPVAAKGLPPLPVLDSNVVAAEAQRVPPPFADSVPAIGASVAGPSTPSARSFAASTFIVDHISALTPDRGGYRTLVVGESESVDPTATAIAIAKGLAALGHPTILVEWSHGTGRLSRVAGLSTGMGMAEVISGAAGFEDVIDGLPGSRCHVIASAGGLADVAGAEDPDHVNLVLDALDEAYAHIVVVGDCASAQQLFETTEGRFDAGVTVTTKRSGARGPGAGATDGSADGGTTFLGFEVAGIELLRLDVTASGKTTQLTRLPSR